MSFSTGYFAHADGCDREREWLATIDVLYASYTGTGGSDASKKNETKCIRFAVPLMKKLD